MWLLVQTSVAMVAPSMLPGSASPWVASHVCKIKKPQHCTPPTAATIAGCTTQDKPAGCGLTHEGVSDKRGYTVSLHCETQSNVKVAFYRKQ